jgi:carbonic anhydrase
LRYGAHLPHDSADGKGSKRKFRFKPLSLSAFVVFYQIDNSLRKRKSGFNTRKYKSELKEIRKIEIAKKVGLEERLIETTNPHSISRRGLLRLGALTVLTTAISPFIARNEALGEVCNPDAPTTPAAALQALIDGNARWAAEDQEHPGEDTGRRVCLANNSQTPFASILSCSDSRVPPELIFDQGLGDLFVARVAGNTASGRLVDSLLYGTDNLGSPVLFVLGHSQCGAVTTAVTSYPNSHHLRFVNLIFPAVRQARAVVKANGGDPNDAAQVIPFATNQNVLITVDRLRKHFRSQVNAGTLMVAGGVYDLGTQVVTVLTTTVGATRD